MPAGLDIGLAPERLDEGSPEERAAFGLFTILAGNTPLIQGFDHSINGWRPGPLVSGYHAAEWFAWNWWRLRWEPRSAAPDWWRAHRMTAIGEGYIWPNLTIFSDGVRTALIPLPSVRPDARPFRYLGGLPTVIPSLLFEEAVDSFIPQVVARLRDAGLPDTNLDAVWRDVLAERADPEVAKRRRIEALLGRDADAVDDTAIEILMADIMSLGEAVVDEVAADRAQDHAQTGAILTAAAFRQIAATVGTDAAIGDMVPLGTAIHGLFGADMPAWQVGAAAARQLRAQEALGSDPVSDSRLARMAGTRADVLADPPAANPMSFTLVTGPATARIVLRSRWRTSRRFDLARLIGDRQLAGADGALFPATRAYTYRQKFQRAFAAELLSPFEAVDAMLDGDYSEEGQQDVAAHFDVSVMVINTQLISHRRIERGASDEDFDVTAA